MTTAYNPGVHKFAIFLSVCTFCLLIAGALVTSNDAAPPVPDWPLSYGTLTPPMVGGIRYEHSHRVIAGVLGLLSVVLAVWVWAKDGRRWRSVVEKWCVSFYITGSRLRMRALHRSSLRRS